MATRIIVGDCRDVLATLPERSIQCVVTSPPYFGLRDYGTAAWDGGDPACDHKKEVPVLSDTTSTLGIPAGGGPRRIGENNSTVVGKGVYRDRCGKCGATRTDRQIGLESSVDAYVAALVGVFREVRRCLRDDGTVFLNLGDSYAGGKTGNTNGLQGSTLTTGTRMERRAEVERFKGETVTRGVPDGLKPKDLIGVPWRVAFALQADGWYLRSDIIWNKPNPMPESVTDRVTRSHEYLFLLTKRATYFYDSDAVREPLAETTIERNAYGRPRETLNRRNGDLNRWGGATRTGDSMPSPTGRNRRSVWTIPTAPFPGSHFATFPPALVEPCLRAGTSERGACPGCGAPWVRVVERVAVDYGMGSADTGDHKAVAVNGDAKRRLRTPTGHTLTKTTHGTTGWKQSCACPPAEPVACVCLDPFAGAGTVGLVAERLGRDSILIELSESYASMARDRIRGDAPLWAKVGD